ncbi:hypothetical protein CXB51_024848 [Gossypium anomalum]|uniref:DUF7745 domain-containing protein n=1 Tax=Gossypium anomalum TaxID=47600 RepID=A0A8J5Y9P5_9ROSI|nr:hypothetical protein CXB51_024848 [Gossypium anomalum]
MTVVVVPLSGSEKLRFREVFTFAWASGLLLGYICTYVFVRFSSPYGHRDMCPPKPNLNYGDLPYLLDIKVDKHLFQAMVQFWNPVYSCFTFGEVDLVPTLEEYTTLLRCPRIQGNKAYVRAANLPTFMKKLMMITGMSEQWAAARIQQKGDGKCIPWASLRNLILAHPDVKRRVHVLALSIYGLVIFQKEMGHIDEAVADLFDRLGKQNTPVPAILAETFRSLNACRRVGEGRFIGCAQLLSEAAATPRRDNITEERWMEILQNLQEEDDMWKAPWMTPSEILYRRGSFDWGDHYKKKMREISEAWKKICCVKILTKGPTITLEYKGWFSKRINDNIPRLSLGAARSMKENLRVIPSELEKIEVEKVRKEKRKIEEDRDDLKTIVNFRLSSSRQERDIGRESFTIFRIKSEIGTILWKKP